jgi:hypothetical protein
MYSYFSSLSGIVPLHALSCCSLESIATRIDRGLRVLKVESC